ncbi:MAG: cell division protein ZipA [Gammaproteobacteria bacterium]|nr:MAG: cell division protein ZipA [Gammaproteobacteria bacterium]
MSNWLTGIIVLLIIIILADGFRRTWNARRNRLDVSPALKKSLKNHHEHDDEVINEAPPSYISELPNGGARVVTVRDRSDRPQRERKPSARELKEQRRREAAVKRTPEQTRLNLEESVPILMESVDHRDASLSDENGRIEPSFSEENNFKEDSTEHHPDELDVYEDRADDEGDYDEGYDDEHDEEHEEAYDDEEADDYSDEDEEIAEEEAKSAAPQAEPEEVLIINIMAAKGDMFNGSELLDIVLKCGLRYGSMDIFHRYADTKGEGALLFSMANMVRPGTFDLDAMDEFSTPGVSLFMTLPIEADSMQSFDLMVETAQAISQTLNGELKDEQRSAMTKQTLEHSRQRIRDFERKKLFRRPR